MAYRIRELREKKKLTQEQLAQMSGVSRTTIVLLDWWGEQEPCRRGWSVGSFIAGPSQFK